VPLHSGELPEEKEKKSVANVRAGLRIDFHCTYADLEKHFHYAAAAPRNPSPVPPHSGEGLRRESMDQLSIKTPNPKCRLHWCLIEFID
jgi:hypothetical protein